MTRNALNLRDLGGIPLQDVKGKTPHGLYLRCGKLSALTPEKCKKLCQEYHITCVIDLRTPIEAQEFPDPLPDGVEYKLISLLIRDYMRTNRNAFWPTIKKCLVVLMLTHNWELVKTCYTSFMAQRDLIETAIRKY